MSFSIKHHQREIALVSGYALVALLFFNLGRITFQKPGPEIQITEPLLDLSQLNSNSNNKETQSPAVSESVAGQSFSAQDCAGKIKGNISSSGRIYHLPNGAFYKRTIPELCFNTEAEAREAGFRKSTR